MTEPAPSSPAPMLLAQQTTARYRALVTDWKNIANILNNDQTQSTHPLLVHAVDVGLPVHSVVDGDTQVLVLHHYL